jgi:predicted metal-binding membrane protein
LLALAGAFQFSSLKYACLDKCRHPGPFMLRFYRRGARGGLQLGLRHGLFCLGCCWALMLVMFSVGVASLFAMAMLTALMVYEKTQPRGRQVVPVAGVTLFATALMIAVYSA